MTIKTSAQIAGDQGSGLRPFGYKVEFVPNPAGGFADPRDGAWQTRMMMLESVQIKYGSAGSAQMRTPDIAAIDTTQLPNAPQLIVQPAVGEVVRVSINDGNSWRVVFKGSVSEVYEDKSSSVSVWGVKVDGCAARLDDTLITAEFNPYNNPINPTPRFSPTGVLAMSQLRTVYQIAQEIMSYRNAWNSPGYFSFADINWHGLDTSTACGAYIPSDITFANTPKGQALAQLLDRAGNFTFYYDPNTDQIHIISLNRACTQCGPQWPLVFAPDDAQSMTNTQTYAYQLKIKEDNTTWSIAQAANVCRVVTPPIEFYSGHYIIPERVTADTNTVAMPGDTVAQQQARSISPDRAYYRFTSPSPNGIQDSRTLQRYFVGMPLFPDWNVFDDWLPALFQINGINLPAGFTLATAATYNGQIELQNFTQGDESAARAPRIGRQENLHVYQAWFVKSVCPACSGSGLVQQVYSTVAGQPANTPQMAITYRGPTGAQHPVVTVQNYIMKPMDFGGVDSSGNRLPPPAGLQPWVDNGTYPVPWQNTCPYCRGIGMKPEYRIRNIQQTLFEGRNNQASLTAADEISLDPANTAGGPETWESSVNRVIIKDGPLLQVEEPLSSKWSLPTYAHRNDTFAALTNSSQDNADLWWFHLPHPLTGFGKVMPTINANLTGDPSQTQLLVKAGDTKHRDQLVPPTADFSGKSPYDCRVPFTFVRMGSSYSVKPDLAMGRVIFDEPVFITCGTIRNPIRVSTNGMCFLDSTGLLATEGSSQPGGGTPTRDAHNNFNGFWRPARVWMTFHYIRDKYYWYGDTNPFTGVAIPTTTVNYTNADGQTSQYMARAMILNGRYCLEVRRAGYDPTKVSPDARTIETSIDDDSAIIRVTEQDFWTSPVATTADQALADWANTKITTLGNTYAQGRAIRMDPPSPGEVVVQINGYIPSDDWGAPRRPRSYVWTMRDDRPRLLGLAIRNLEHNNDIQVNGSIVLVGMSMPDNAGYPGLGYVNYPNWGTAAVKGITYSFEDGYTTEIELYRETARIGEMPPNAQDRQDQISREVIALKKYVNSGSFTASGGGLVGGNTGSTTGGGPNAEPVRSSHAWVTP